MFWGKKEFTIGRVLGQSFHIFAACCLLLMLLNTGTNCSAASSAARIGSFVTAGQLLESHTGAVAVALPGGRIMVIGGIRDDVASSTVEIITSAGAISQAERMLEGRSEFAAVVLGDGRVLVIGGKGTGGQPLATAELYDPEKNTWQAAGGMRSPRTGHTATMLPNGTVLIAGGSTGAYVESSVEVFDPDTNRFRVARGQLATARYGHATTLMADGQVLITGGSNGAGCLRSSEIYDPASEQVSEGPDLRAARTNHSATKLYDGRILVVGGNDGKNDLDSAEVLAVGAKKFVATASMTGPRGKHAALTLPDNNNILFAGGESATGFPELYAPWRDLFSKTGSAGDTRLTTAALAVGEGTAFLINKSSASDGVSVYGFATIRTTKDHYLPGETIEVNGSGWQAEETVTLTIRDQSKGKKEKETTLTADSSGNISGTVFTTSSTGKGSNYLIIATGRGAEAAAAAATTGAANLDQCANGPVGGANLPCDWVNGNLGASKSHYVEGASIAYRMVFTGMSAGTHTVTIEYDTLKGGVHAIDYLTSWNYSAVTNPIVLLDYPASDPCYDPDPHGTRVCGPSAPTSTWGIPIDPLVTGHPDFIANGGVVPAGQVFSMWGGTITAVGAPTAPGGTDDPRDYTITFTVASNDSTAVLAWGGHIATREDWGFYNSAVNIPGSPYHMRLIDLDGSGGNQDRSLSADAVFFPALITVVKHTVPDTDTTEFNYVSNPTDGNGVSAFSLSHNESQLLKYLQSTATVTETIPSGWSLISLACVTDAASMGSFSYTTNLSTGVLNLVMEEGNIATCTFTNERKPKITLVKVVQNNHGGTAAPDDFSLTLGGTGVLSGVATEVTAGTAYAVNETMVSGYEFVSITGNTKCPAALGETITPVAGDDITCTITNRDIAPKITLVKVVQNTHGGTAAPDDFSLTLGGTGVLSGVATEVVAGTAYSVNETMVSGYEFVSITGNAKCPAVLGGTVTPALADNITCTITNRDMAPKITLVKVVQNNHGGTAAPNDFNLTLGGTGVLSGVATEVTAGTAYAVNESMVSGYEFVSITGGAKCPAVLGGTVTPALGDDITCTITNRDIAPKITLIKNVQNTHGGAAAPNDFNLTLGGTGVLSGVATEVVAGTAYSVTETMVSGYEFVSITGDAKCPATLGGTITPALADNITCTITNRDIAPKITLVKVVQNNHGGTAVPNDFNLTLGGSGVLSGVATEVMAGTTYAVNESLVSGYEFVSITGDAKCPGALGGTVTPVLADNITCTITNRDIAPKITLVKVVQNTHGGTAVPNDFNLTLGGAGVLSGVATEVTAGTAYSVNETLVSGYEFVSITGDAKCPAARGGTITPALGDNITCTITNRDIAPKITLVKVVQNTHGGTAVPNDFNLTLGGAGVLSGVATEVTAGTAYAVNESLVSGYEFVSITGDAKCPAALAGTVTPALGDNITCTITNRDIAPKITLIKVVQNTHGGTAAPNDFNLTLGGAGVLSGVATEVTAGTAYSVNESLVSGYEFVSITGDAKCPAVLGGTVTPALADNITCTITNRDLASTLTLVKTVNNQYGGTATAADFQGYINGSPVPWGAAQTLTPGNYTASESTSVLGYQASAWGGDCAANGSVTLALGQNKTCTITNSDTPPRLIVNKVVVPSDAGGLFNLTISGTGFNHSTPNQGNGGTTGEVPLPLAGVYTVGETAGTNTSLGDYVTTISGACAPNGSVTVLVGQVLTCTITNTKKAHVKVIKTTNGVVNSTLHWQFTLKGPGVDLSDDTYGKLDGTLDFGMLAPGVQYTLCEINVAAGWTGTWMLNGAPITPVLDGTAGTLCYQFTPDPNAVLTFEVNNTYPQGTPRTIGYWKNWNACSTGNQALVAARNGGSANGFWLVEDLLPIELVPAGITGSAFTVATCETAVRVLDMSDVASGAKMASDAAYSLAAQLLAALFNQGADATWCTGVNTAVTSAKALLDGINFNGTGNYLGPQADDQALRAEATSLAGTLDMYNNGNLCPAP